MSKMKINREYWASINASKAPAQSNVVSAHCVTFASDLKLALDKAGSDASGCYLMLDDGTQIVGFEIREETLSDGSKVRNLYFKKEARFV